MEFMESMGIIGGADGPTAVFVAGVISKQALVISIVAGIILCIFGLKLMRALAAIVGLLVGAGVGAVIVSVAHLTGTISLIVILGCAIAMALLSVFLRRVGAFFSVLCYVYGALMAVLPKTSVIIIIIAAVVALILAIIAAIYVEPLVVTVSSVAGGLLAGPAMIALIGLDDKMWIGYIIAVVLAGLGLLVQLLMQSGKIKKNEKMHSKKIKEEVSRESDVEKARMILDEDDEL